MIPIKVIAVICSMVTTEDCRRVTVTTTDLSGIRTQGCQVGMPQLAEFMSRYPAYRFARWICEPMDAPQKERT